MTHSGPLRVAALLFVAATTASAPQTHGRPGPSDGHFSPSPSNALTLGSKSARATASSAPLPRGSAPLPRGLTPSDWTGIRAEYERHRHAVRPSEASASEWRAR